MRSSNIDFEIGDNVVYPHHGAGQVVKKEEKKILGEKREYLTIKILHNDMTVMVPCENAGKAGLRRVIDEETVKKVLAVLADDVSEMPKNWNRRFKHNRDKIKTGDIYELAEVVRNLAIREQDKGLSTGEKQMYTRAKKILASELMYALEKNEDEAEAHLDELLLPLRPTSSPPPSQRASADGGRRCSGGRRHVANALAPTGPRRSCRSPAARCSSGRSTRCARPAIERDRRRAAARAAQAPAGCAGVCAAGPTRSQSVRAALAAGGPRRPVVVHDAARPLVDAGARSARRSPALRRRRRGDRRRAGDRHDQGGRGDGVVARTLDRSRLWAVQTPQAFRRDGARARARRRPTTCSPPATDDASLVERAGGTRALVVASPRELQGHDAARPARRRAAAR